MNPPTPPFAVKPPARDSAPARPTELSADDVPQGRKRMRWAIHPLRLDGPWSGFVLAQAYPVRPDPSPYRSIVEAILRLLPESRPPFVPEAFLQMRRLDFRNDIPAVQEHSDILGDYGLGYFPHLPPPTRWKKEDFLDLFPPQKLRPMAHDIMQVDGGPDAVGIVRDRFLGSGAFAQVFCDRANTFYAKATALFKPQITDKLIRTFPYLAPMLVRRAVENATPDELEAWTCGASLYLRESEEDNGLLVLRRGEVDPLLRDLAEGRILPEAEFLLG